MLMKPRALRMLDGSRQLRLYELRAKKLLPKFERFACLATRFKLNCVEADDLRFAQRFLRSLLFGLTHSVAYVLTETRWIGPRLGEHTDQVLAELGYSKDKIAHMHEAKAV